MKLLEEKKKKIKLIHILTKIIYKSQIKQIQYNNNNKMNKNN